MRTGWERGLPAEIAYWDAYLAERGGARWGNEFRRRFDPRAPLQEAAASLLDARLGRPPRVLDVGAGPATWLGKRWGDVEIDVVAVDPLADVYGSVLARHGLVPPIRTERCDAEHVSERFGPGTFDMAFSRNALDHAYNPAVAIVGMLGVVRAGAPVLLMHVAEEGRKQRYQGLHQWNFSEEAGELTLWRPGERLSVTRLVRGWADVSVERTSEDWIVAVLRRRKAGA